jgi:hypothetical protein
MPDKQTTAVSVYCVLYSADADSPSPPYEVKDIQGTISYSDGSSSGFSGWSAENIGTPQQSGATFTFQVRDASYSSSSNVTSVGNWALTFIPRGTTTAQSPFGNNQNAISGSGAANDPVNAGRFTLDLSSVKIKNSGDWDWGLMVQMMLPGGAIKCFSSDPEMEVGS